jgi:predicted enzyme related to lactoylglutathione lyase
MATIVHFELPSADVDRAKGFWSGVFGWTFAGMEGPFEYLMTQGEEPVGAIYKSDGDPAPGSGPIVYMSTDDIDATLAKVTEAGGTAGEKMPIPTIGWFARCKDTEGNSFSLFQSDESVPGDFGG